MGQKTHPIGFRLVSTRTWSSRRFATKNYADHLHEDVQIPRFIKDHAHHPVLADSYIGSATTAIAVTPPRTGRGGCAASRSGSSRAGSCDPPRPPRPRSRPMLMPKRVKYRKAQRGNMRGKAQRGSTLSFGEYGLKALEPGWVTNRQIEAARVALTRSLKRGGKVWIRVFPDKPVTKKPAETRMGKGKGNPEEWVAVVKPGRILYEMEGVPEDVAREAFRTAANKIGITTKFVTRTRSL